MLSVTTTQASAEPKASTKSCDEVLQLCDAAVKDLREVVNKQDIKVKDQNDLILTQRTKIDQQSSELNSILRKPEVWAVIGFIAGVWVMKK